MNKLLVSCIMLTLTFGSLAQGWMSQGARSSALANNGVAFDDVMAYHHNPGALGFLKKGAAALSYESRYFLKELQTQGLAVAIPLKVGVISTGAQFYGYDAYRTTRAGVGYSLKLHDNVAAGVQVNYLNMSFGNSYYGTKHGVSAELGLLAKLNEKVNIGFSVVNLTRTKLAKYKDDRLGTLLRLGVSYKVIDQLLLVGEIEQEIAYQARLRAGVEYHPIDVLYVRIGVQGAPIDIAFGFGLDIKGYKIDLSTQYNQVLGWSPAISFMFDFYDPSKK